MRDFSIETKLDYLLNNLFIKQNNNNNNEEFSKEKQNKFDFLLNKIQNIITCHIQDVKKKQRI